MELHPVVERIQELITPKRVALAVAGLGIAAWAFEEVTWRLWHDRWRVQRAFTGAIVRRIDRL